MGDTTPSNAPEPVGRLRRTVQTLRMAVYSQADPSANPALSAKLAEAEAALRALEPKPDETPRAAPVEVAPVPTAVPRGRFLGPETTGLKVTPTVLMQPIPTGIYHLLDPDEDPLLSVEIENVSEAREAKRVCVKAFLEGISGQAVRTVELKRRQKETLRLLPTLLPEQARAITEIRRATLHVVVEDLDGKPESHDTYSVICLARTSSFNSVRRPDSAEPVDLTRYYGAWVTPHAESVQQCIREAVEYMPDRQLWGYLGDPDSVVLQVEALYKALRARGLCYVNSVIDFGAASGLASQRTRLPRESLDGKLANCIDGTVLMASLMEGISLNAAIVLVPGHAFVGWECWEGEDTWAFLETTMIGTHDFQDARASGERQFALASKEDPESLRKWPLDELRRRRIWPME